MRRIAPVFGTEKTSKRIFLIKMLYKTKIQDHPEGKPYPVNENVQKIKRHRSDKFIFMSVVLCLKNVVQ